MDKVQLFVIVLAVAVLGVRLYLKYFKKDNLKQESVSKKGANELTSTKDDDYEPYAKR